MSNKIRVEITHNSSINSKVAWRHFLARMDGWDHGEKYDLLIDNTSLTDDQLEDKLTHSYVAGQHTTFERVVKQLKERAGVLFANGKDTEAKLIRDLASEFDVQRKDASDCLQECIKKVTEP